ncbi:MAG: FecR domain-containing protein, partial [Planctomycetaceae bacterium]|nr:FecR domain-containing protein [Planctomycetaceae bacterium]
MIFSEDRELLDAYLASELDEDEVKALENRICTEEDLARLLIEISCEETVIREWVEVQKSQIWLYKLVGQTPVRNTAKLRGKIIAAALLLLTVTLGFAFWLPHLISPRVASIEHAPDTQTVVEAALFESISGGELRTQEILCKVNERLRTREKYHLNGGTLRLRMKSGVQIYIAGPARFHLLNTNDFYLSQGTLIADVPPQAIGFEIQAPSINVVDLGTRFGFHVDESGGAEVHVFQGVVSCLETESNAAPRLPQKLVTGQSSKKLPGGKLVRSQTDADTLFASCLKYESRITQLSGDLKLLSDLPESVMVSKITSNENIYVFQE